MAVFSFQRPTSTLWTAGFAWTVVIRSLLYIDPILIDEHGGVFSAANKYTLDSMLGPTIQSGKRQAPCITVRGRSKIGGFSEDLSKVSMAAVSSVFSRCCQRL